MKTTQINEVKIKLRLTTYMCDNRYHFCVSNDDWGILKYSLSGTNDDHSLSNLQYTTLLPEVLDDYTDVDALVKDITRALKTGTHAKEVDVVYAKSR